MTDTGDTKVKARTAAERQAAYRARKGVQCNVMLDAELKAALDLYLARQRADKNPDITMSDVIAKLLKTQLLRQR